MNECVFKNSTGIYIANENTYNNSIKHVIENSNFTDMQPSTILLSFFDRTTPTFAIYNLGQYNTTIRNNQITTNIGSHALYLKGYNNITNNNIEGFIYITGKNNTLTDNTLKYNKTYVVELTSSAYNNTITDNSITASIFTGDRAVKTANNENTIENNTINTGSDYTITEANYNDFFDTNGDIKNVPTGSKLTLQTLNNKQLNIKNVNVYITNDNTSILNNCSIYVDNTAKVTIYGLNIQNTNNKDYVIKVNSKDNTIEANNITVNTNTPIHTITITDDRNTIYNNTIITNGPSNNITYTDNYGIADTIGLLIQSSNNIVELNKITTINTTTQPYGTINGISIQNKTNRHTNNLIRNNTITTQTNDYAYSINLQNTDENIIIGNNITTTSNNYANGIQLIDSNKNYINAKINITATNNAYGVVISGINTIPADNNITVNMNLTANNVYGVDLYNTNNTIITSNDSRSPYYLYGNSIMVNMYKANYTDISFLTPYQNGTSTAFNVINSSNVAINGINYTQQTNGIKYNTGTYTQITNSTDVYIGILVKGNYTENATINTPKTPIQITNSQLININGLKITTTLHHTILLTNTNNSIIQNNILKSSKGNGNTTIKETRCFNNSLINNTGPDNTNTINLKSLKNKQQIKSIKKAEENIILTEENYDQYFTNGEIKSGIKKITLGSDLYNKNMTIGNDLIEINNYLHKYTLYNTTIIYKHNVTLNNITIINTDEREATFILSSTLKPFEMYGEIYHLDIFIKNCTIIQKNKGDSVLFKEESNATANIHLMFSRIIMEGNKAIVINFTNSPYAATYCKINVKTNVSTPVLLENLGEIYGCIIIVDEPEDQPIIISRAEYAQQECYLLTPFRRGSSAMEGDPWDNLPADGNNTLPIYTTITNKELKVGKINDINIKVVDVWLKDVNEGNITVKINNDIIGTVPVTNGSATVQYSPQEEANYTIVLDYQTNTENYVQYDWIDDHSGGGMCRFKPCNDSFIIDAVIPITTISIDPTVAQINDTISISASVTSDNTPVTGGRVIFKARDKILKDIDGNVLFANVKDGKAVINNYTIPSDWIKPNTKMTAVYSGTSTIQSASSTIDLDISKIMPEIELEPQTVEVGKEVTLIAKVTSKQTTYSSDNNTLITSDTNKETITKPVNGGRVVFKINGRTLRDSNGNIIYGNVVDGIASITYTVPDSFTPKNYNITCVYGNKLYERNEGNTILTVKTNTKKIATKSLKTLTDTRIELSGETQVTIGGDTVITAKLVDATGNAINGVKISGYLGDTFISEESPTENGEVEFWIQNSVLSEARDYTFTAKSEETTEYAASTNSTIISVNKVETELTINEPLDIVVDVNTPITINGTLTNATGGAIANAIINLNITNVGSVTNTTGSDGKYSYTWIPSKKGTFYVNATYDGNDKYGDAFASTYGDVDPLTTTITLNIKDGDEFLVNTPITISGTILDNNNNPPEHVLLTIRFNKINIIISAENGSYSHTTIYDQTPKYPRLYELSVEYAGNDTYNGDKITVTINVTSKMKTMMSVDEGPIDVVVTDNVTINGTLTDKEGMPIEGAEIEVSTGDLITTNSTGGYSYTYKADTVGENIPITFKYYGNKTYESTSAETSINVLKLNTTLRLTGTTQYTYGMPVIIKVNLTDAKGNPISDASIDGTISNMEGITTIITGNDGTAEFYITDLPVSEYTLTATYAGTDTKYNGNTTDIIFEINKLGTILSINPELENIDVNTQKTINGTLTDVNGNVLNGVNITMSITGMEEFNLTTDNNGKYSYTWTPTTVGTYTVKVIYDGSKIYEDAYNDTFFDVEPLSSTITVNVKNSDELRVDSPLNINGTLMDNNNNPIADATLTIIFNGVSTNVNTDKDGLYKFDTTTPSYAGLYDLTVEYDGNDTYNGDEKTVKLDVKKISTSITVNKQETVLVPLDNIVINGTLTDEYNIPMKDAEITIAITGENNITVKTNDEGKYTYTYKTTKEGIYNVVVLYEGNDKYYESSANTSFNVTKIDSSITIDAIGSVDANSDVNVTGILVDSAQNAIINQEVTITVNNKKYTTTTGSDGKYVVTIM
ncbi:carboxypeptidase regulatory-like domain-containing protein, partial [Methanosphaera stadtmanae]